MLDGKIVDGKLIDEFGKEYVKYRGQIYMTKKDFENKSSIGINIVRIEQIGEDLKIIVMAYEVITRDTNLEELVLDILKRNNYTDEFRNELLRD